MWISQTRYSLSTIVESSACAQSSSSHVRAWHLASFGSPTKKSSESDVSSVAAAIMASTERCLFCNMRGLFDDRSSPGLDKTVLANALSGHKVVTSM